MSDTIRNSITPGRFFRKRTHTAGTYIAALSVCLFCAACASVNQRSRAAVVQEREIGRALAARLAERYGILRDAGQTRYLNLVGRTVARNSPRPELPYTFGILDTDEINAYSCPGGYVLITRGALELIRDESELAGVLAHELSHAALDHSGDFGGGDPNLETLAGLISGASGAILSTSIRTATDRLHETLLENGRERDLELEADRAGAILAAQAGYDASAQIRYLSRVRKSPRSAIFVKTHPPSAQRIQLLRTFVARQGLRGGRKNAARYAEETRPE